MDSDRFDLLILLLVSLIHIQALEKLSPVAALTPNSIAMPLPRVSSSSWTDEKKVFESPEDNRLVAHGDPESRGMQRRRDTQTGPGGGTNSKIIISGPSHSGTLLAEKLAQEALHSREMQDTIKDLTSLNDGHKKHQEVSTKTQKAFRPGATAHSVRHPAKTAIKSKGRKMHKSPGNRRHNKHKKRPRKHRHQKSRLKRHHPKKESSKTARGRKSGKSVSRERSRGLKEKCGSERSAINSRRKRRHQITDVRRKIDQQSGKDLKPFLNDDENFIEVLPNFESTHRKYRRTPIAREGEKEDDVIHRKRSHIIAQLMLTTTRDPTKKNPGDQGVEYSEYYNDDDDILLPDIRTQSKVGEVAKTLMGGQGRSVREAADENFFDQHYYDSSNGQQLEEESERSKRNDQKFVRVLEEPINSMEYVDNTYGPVQAKGVVENDHIPQYLTNYNYIPDQDALRQGDAYRVPSIPSAEVLGMRPPIPNQIASDGHIIFNPNSPMIEYPPKSDASPMIDNAQPVAPGQSGFPGNVVLSQLPRPRLGDGNSQYYTIKEVPLQPSTISVMSPMAFSISSSPGKAVESLGDRDVNVPESEKAAAPFATSSSLSEFNPTSATSDRGTSSALASSKAFFAAFGTTSSSTDVNSMSHDSEKLFSRLRDVRPEMGGQEVGYYNENDGAENTRGPDQIEPIASRETGVESTAVKKGKKKGSHVTKTEVETVTTVSEKKDAKKHGISKATKSDDQNLSSTTCTPRSNAPEPVKTTIMVNETKAVANEILNEIIDELEELRLENPKNEQREGLPCRLTGSWVTARAGVRIDMKVTNHTVRVALDHLTPPITTEGLLNVTWNVTGFAPFKRGGPFTLLATNNHTKTLAVFVGACKVCQGIDTIEGSWTVSREPRDCRDFQMSTNIFNEIFRRTRLYSAIKDKQLKHETQTLSSTIVTTNGNSSTPESTSTIHEVSDNLGKFRNQSLELNVKG